MAREPERGISPEILLGHVENTAPWLFQAGAPLTPYTRTVIEYRASPRKLSHEDYFALCLSCHYSTVATFVPTDVDNQIRKHLWHPALPAETTERMAALVLDSLGWDFRPLTARYQEFEGAYVCGHQGEWFSVAVGAYAAHRERNPALARLVLEKILAECRAEAFLFAGLRRERNGLGLLRASTAIAHNLGDLDRVIDQWELPADDPLRAAVYKLGHAKVASFGPEQEELLLAGSLNKEFMASENHRHYPLRKPKALRRSAAFLLPLGPFFDSWGETVGASPLLDEREHVEIAEALLDGFERLSSPKVPLYGYARALAGLRRSRPRALDELSAKNRKLLERGRIPEIQRASAREFEAQWSKKALVFLGA